jgi:DNA recombination protein RmuC
MGHGDRTFPNRPIHRVGAAFSEVSTMSTLFVTVLVLLSGVLFGGLGYLIARSRAAAERGRLESDLKVAEERARQSGKQADELRAERAEGKARAERLDRTQGEQSAELRGQGARLASLGTELTAVREKLSDAETEVERLRADIANRRKEKEDLDRDLRDRDRKITELRTLDERHRQESAEYKQRLAGLQAQQQSLDVQAAALKAVREELDQSREDNNRLQTERFQALAADMLAKSQEKLVTSADAKLGATSAAMHERLEQLDHYLRQFDTQRASADAQLKQQITQLAEENARGREQTRSLVEAQGRHRQGHPPTGNLRRRVVPTLRQLISSSVPHPQPPHRTCPLGRWLAHVHGRFRLRVEQ